MTKDEILAMPAGREMDVLVAKMVMKQSPINPGFYTSDVYITRRHNEHMGIVGIFKPSTYIQHAWEVVEKFDNHCMLNNVHGIWECYFPDSAMCRSKSAPLAICYAALLAVTE